MGNLTIYVFFNGSKYYNVGRVVSSGVTRLRGPTTDTDFAKALQVIYIQSNIGTISAAQDIATQFLSGGQYYSSPQKITIMVTEA